jgi:hypothetical protein
MMLWPSQTESAWGRETEMRDVIVSKIVQPHMFNRGLEIVAVYSTTGVWPAEAKTPLGKGSRVTDKRERIAS